MLMISYLDPTRQHEINWKCEDSYGEMLFDAFLKEALTLGCKNKH